MARKPRKDKKSKPEKDKADTRYLSRETSVSIAGISAIVFSIILLLSAFSSGGRIGGLLFRLFSYLFGIGYYLLPVALIMLAVSLFRFREKDFRVPQTLGSALFFISSLSLVNLVFPTKGGIVGDLISKPLVVLFDFYASLIILIALIVISFLVVFDKAIKLDLIYLWNKIFKKDASTEELMRDDSLVIERAIEKVEPTVSGITNTEPGMRKEEKKARSSDEAFVPLLSHRIGKDWNPPPLSLLERDSGKPGVGDIKANANLIKRTLLNFGIVVEMDEISIGPSVTRYAFKPAEGVKLSKILGLQTNLELALAAHPVRIEAPIPGKSLVGIEVPNTQKSIIGLGSLLSEDGFAQSDKPLLVALGRDISGSSHFENIGKMPHLLVAGATGSGKSVTIHAIINSLLYRNPPESLKFLMIDPKRVELTLYNNIPHLLTPVITEPKKAILALKWATKEMERRYELLEKESVRDIDSYHKNVLMPAIKKAGKDGTLEADPMPYILVVIDELADLMQTYPRELEAAIVRLAQMSRAVGIHLILSTQRPSVNIITGLIKANIPARLALQVSSQIDSRTIIDAAGAEKLLGAGDMLYQSGDMGKPKRIQSAFIGEKEVKAVTKYLRDEYADELQNEINFSEANVSNSIFSSAIGGEDDFGGDDDELYEEARATVVAAGKASTSFLQRKLRVGYARAARLIDILEERGVIGAGSGAKPRDVLIKNEGTSFGVEESEALDEEI
jgi:S-DNA-T family DNA segregation ATPase FtsK/SpoIIIE